MNKAWDRLYFLVLVTFYFPFFLHGTITYVPEPHLDFSSLYHASNRMVLGVLPDYDFSLPLVKNENETNKDTAKKQPSLQEYALYTITMHTPSYQKPTFSTDSHVKHASVFLNFSLNDEKKEIIKAIREAKLSEEEKKKKKKEEKTKEEEEKFDEYKLPNPLYGGVIHSLASNNFGYVVVLKDQKTGKPDTAVYAGVENGWLTTRKDVKEDIRAVEDEVRKKQKAKNESDKEEDKKELFVTDQELALSTNESGELLDGNGKPTSGIVSVVGINELIVAALAPHEKEGVFGDTGSALSIIAANPHRQSLEPVDVYNGDVGKNIPYSLSLEPGKGIAYDAPIKLGNSVAFHWDNQLKRLFVGLDVSRADATQQGGGTSLLVGHFKSLTKEQREYNETIKKENEQRQKDGLPLKQEKKWYRLVLRPLYQPIAGKHDAIVSFNRSADSIPVRSVVYAIKTMNTSTDKTYLIINGGMTTSQARNRIYALPYKAHIFEPTFGNKDDYTLDEKSECNLSCAAINSEDDAYYVGNGPLPSDVEHPISSIVVINDSIYVALNGPTPGTRGLFKSYPLFKGDGTILCWTPWQRIFGVCDPVHSVWFDTAEFSCLYTTHAFDEAANKKYVVVKKPQWETPSENSGLCAVLNAQFPIGEMSSIKNLYTFDKNTPSFKQGSFSLLVANNYNKIVVLESGNNSSGEFLPLDSNDSRPLMISSDGTVPPSDGSYKGIVISGGALDDLQFIQTVAVSRSAQKNCGYIFVGGFKGCAVLSDDEGNGWDSSKGLSSGFPELNLTMSFKKLGIDDSVRKIECDDQYVYILTNKALHRIALKPEHFSASNSSTTCGETLITPRELMNERRGVLCDVVVLRDVIIIGTSNGLYYLNKISLQPKEIMFKGTHLHSVAKLWAVTVPNSQGGEYAMVHALEAFISRNTSFAHRICVKDGECELVQEASNSRAFIAFGKRELFCNPYGDVVFYQPVKKINEKSILNFSPQLKNISITPMRNAKLNFDNIYDPSFEVDTMVQETASGKWIIAGSQGLRIFE